MVKTYGPLGRYNRLGNPVPVLHVQSEEADNRRSSADVRAVRLTQSRI